MTIQLRTDLVQGLIDKTGGDPAGEVEDYPVEDWKQAVQDGETRLGYWEEAAINRFLVEETTVQPPLTLPLIERNGGNIWCDYPGIPVEEWQEEVSDDGTRLGYWEYVLIRVAQNLQFAAKVREAAHV